MPLFWKSKFFIQAHSLPRKHKSSHTSLCWEILFEGLFNNSCSSACKDAVKDDFRHSGGVRYIKWHPVHTAPAKPLRTLSQRASNDLGPVLTYFLMALSRTSFHLFFSTSFFLARILKRGGKSFHRRLAAVVLQCLMWPVKLARDHRPGKRRDADELNLLYHRNKNLFMTDEVHRPFVNVCTELAWALVVSGISRIPWFLWLGAPFFSTLPRFSFVFTAPRILFLFFFKSPGSKL